MGSAFALLLCNDTDILGSHSKLVWVIIILSYLLFPCYWMLELGIVPFQVLEHFNVFKNK